MVSYCLGSISIKCSSYPHCKSELDCEYAYVYHLAISFEQNPKKGETY